MDGWRPYPVKNAWRVAGVLGPLTEPLTAPSLARERAALLPGRRATPRVKLALSPQASCHAEQCAGVSGQSQGWHLRVPSSPHSLMLTAEGVSVWPLTSSRALDGPQGAHVRHTPWAPALLGRSQAVPSAAIAGPQLMAPGMAAKECVRRTPWPPAGQLGSDLSIPVHGTEYMYCILGQYYRTGAITVHRYRTQMQYSNSC